MPTYPSDAAVAEFDAMERIADRTLDWQHIGQQCAFIKDAHSIILAAWKREIVFASRTATAYQKHELRALWTLIDDEERARKNGKRCWWEIPNLRKEQSIRERCEAVHQKVTIEHFIERELGIQLRRNRCRCPVHDGDSEYSFSIRNGYAKCFVCGFSGDVITLAQELWKLARPIDAVKRLENW